MIENSSRIARKGKKHLNSVEVIFSLKIIKIEIS